MTGPVDEVPERFHGGPDAQVDEDHRIGEDAQRGRVAILGLQPPDESGTAVRERVDRHQPGHEVGDVRVIERLP